MNSERLSYIISLVFSLLVIFIVVSDILSIYGKTETQIEAPYTELIAMEFDLVRESIDVDSIMIDSIRKNGDKIIRIRNLENAYFPYCTFYESDNIVDMVEFRSYYYSKGDARLLMKDISSALSKIYTSNKGIRRFKRSRNFVINTSQDIMLEVRIERDFDDYAVHVYQYRYSWIRRFKRGLYWRCLAFERPGISLGRLFISQ